MMRRAISAAMEIPTILRRFACLVADERRGMKTEKEKMLAGEYYNPLDV